MRNITVFVDESGTLPDPRDRVVIVAAVGTFSPTKIETIIKSVRKKGHFKKPVGEIKFYTLGNKTKTLFLEKIANENFDIFILTIEKMGRAIPDTPQHFAVICGFLLENVLSFYQKVEKIIFDRHFHKSEDIKEFNQALENFLDKDLPKINHVDSKKDKNVNIADMVAGAVLAKETGKNKSFYEIFKNRIINESRLNWPEVKRKLFQK